MSSAASLVEKGFVAHQGGDFGRADLLYREALDLDPRNFNALQLLGVLSIHQHDHVRAEHWLARALEVMPTSTPALLNYALVLQELKRSEAALECYGRVLAQDPGNAQAHNGRAMVLNALDLEDQAFAALNQAVAADPDFTEALFNRGSMLDRRGEFAMARSDYERVLALDSGYRDAMYQLGVSLLNSRQFAAGLTWLERLLAIDPGHRLAAHYRALTAWHFCDWSDYAARRAAIIEDARDGIAAATVFQFLSVTDDARLQLRLAATHRDSLGLARIRAEPAARSEPGSRARIRVAYVAADFREHAVSYLTAGLFELHDRARFEIIGVYFGPLTDDAMQRRVFKSFDRLIMIHDLSDARAATLLREAAIDVAFDLTGATQNARPALFAHRVAPIQINYLGFPGTLWRSCYDYIVGDDIVIPEQSISNYAEAVVLMPQVFQVNDHRRGFSATPTLRAHHGLRDDALVLCAFHAGYKINPTLFAIWMRLLKALPESVLWLAVVEPATRGNLTREAAVAGIEARRLVFAEVVPYSHHLARLGLADLALDTFPFNGGTTTSDILFAGVPIVTCKGEAFAARMSASLLNAVGANELVTTDLAAYETTALQLARDPNRLLALRARIGAARSGSALFDTARFTRDLEAAIEIMLQRLDRAEAADTLRLDAPSARTANEVTAARRGGTAWTGIWRKLLRR